MSFLSYDGLRAAIEDPSVDPAYRLRVEPYDRARLRSASLELHLGASIARWRHRGHVVAQVGPKRVSAISDADFEVQQRLGPGDVVLVEPHEFVLMSVDQWIGMGVGLLGQVVGKSGIGRAGQIVETAGLTDPGFIGILTLEICNLAPFTVGYEVGSPIAQLLVSRLDQPTSQPYGSPAMLSRYQGQDRVMPPRPSATGTIWDPRLRGPWNEND